MRDRTIASRFGSRIPGDFPRKWRGVPFAGNLGAPEIKEFRLALTTDEKILIEHRVANEAKSIVLAYLLLVFVGYFGGHRFYLGRPFSAIVLLLLFLLGYVSRFAGIGFIILGMVLIWLLIDAFLIPGMIQDHKEEVRRRLTEDALANRL